MENNLSRNAQVFKFFAQQCSGIPRKHLVKLAYMADLVARQFLGHPISRFNYILHHFGPYPRETEETIRELESLELARAVESVRATPYDVATKKLFDTGRPVIFDFSLGENEVLAFVVRCFMKMDTEELVEDVVYQTSPFLQAVSEERFKGPIHMEIVDGQGKQELGFDLERVLAATRQADLGDSMVAREWFDALRNRITARYAE